MNEINSQSKKRKLLNIKVIAILVLFGFFASVCNKGDSAAYVQDITYESREGFINVYNDNCLPAIDIGIDFKDYINLALIHYSDHVDRNEIDLTDSRFN